MLDFFSGWFWLFVAVGTFLIGSLDYPAARRYSLAGLNLTVLVYLLGYRFPVALMILLGSWLGLKLIASKSPGKVAGVVGGSALFALFLLHKRPDLMVLLHLPGRTGTEMVLTALGISYVALRVVDAARSIADGRKPAPDLPSTVNYLVPFHMLAAGPIQSYDEFASQPPVPEPIGTAKTLQAVERISSGLFKKYILAYGIETLLLTGFRARGWYTPLEVQFNYLWLYLDFSAYSDVAVGVGMLMGVATPENFNHPLTARNLVEYWERWHISLSQFIRRNLFTPIQLALVRRTEGQRPILAASLAFTASFLLCGLWHSVSLRWLGWGAMHAGGLVVCTVYRTFLIRRLGRKGYNQYMTRPIPRVIGIILTFEFAAWALAAATFPFEDLFTWPEYPG